MWGRPYISIEFGEHAVLWFTGIATFLLFLATAGLVVVAVKALGQLQVAVDQLDRGEERSTRPGGDRLCRRGGERIWMDQCAAGPLHLSKEERP